MKKIIIIFPLLLLCLTGHMQPSVGWSKSFPNTVGGAMVRDAIIDKAGNIIVAATIPNVNNSANIDPVFVKYDSFGNVIATWIHLDASTNEDPTQLVCDSVNNIYILTLASGSMQDTVHLIKVDGNTGQEIYNYPLGTGIYPGAIGINGQ